MVRKNDLLFQIIGTDILFGLDFGIHFIVCLFELVSGSFYFFIWGLPRLPGLSLTLANSLADV